MSDPTMVAIEPLYAIEMELIEMFDTWDLCSDELRPELEQRIAEYIAKSIEKVDRIGHVLAQLELTQSNAKTEIERLRSRMQSAERASKRLEAYILEVIRKREGRALKGKNTTLSVRHSESLVITDANLVPGEFKRQTVVTDIPKDPIKRVIRAGEQIPGCHIEQHEHLVRK